MFRFMQSARRLFKPLIFPIKPDGIKLSHKRQVFFDSAYFFLAFPPYA